MKRLPPLPNWKNVAPALEKPWDLVRLQADFMTAMSETAATMMFGRAAELFSKRGDGRGVLLIPGFTGPEISLSPLKAFLKRRGWNAHFWGLGTNRGPQDDEDAAWIAQALSGRLAYLAQKHGGKISLVGQSLGGIYARELAKRHPDLVDRVITLGSAVHVDRGKANPLNSMVADLIAKRTGRSVREHLDIAAYAGVEEPPPVALVALSSPYDGVAPMKATLIAEKYLNQPKAPPRENIEVPASHAGMGTNMWVMAVIADRLAVPVDQWVPFDPKTALEMPSLNQVVEGAGMPNDLMI